MEDCRHSLSNTERYFFLSEDEAKFFQAFCALLVPTGKEPDSDPGAIEVGSVNYVDSTLFGFPTEVQRYFRGIIALVNAKSKEKFGSDFHEIGDYDKDLLLKSLFLDPKSREGVFDLRSIALEGFYSDYHDPWYRGVTPWELVKFEGKRISDLKKDWTFLKVWKDYDSGRRKGENA